MQETILLQKFLQVLSDANRLRIIKFIGTNEKNVSEIIKEMNLSQPLVSHHLRLLRDNNILVSSRHGGPFIFYKLKNTKLLEILNLLSELIPNHKIKESPPNFCCFQNNNKIN